MRLRVFTPAVLLFVATSFSATTLSAHLQGVWSGSVTANETCTGAGSERPVQWTSPARLYIAEAQEQFIGNMVVDAAPRYGEGCTQTGSFRFVVPMAGTSSDSMNFSGTMILPIDAGPAEVLITGHVNGTSMTISSSEPGFTLSGTLTQTNNQQPSTEFTGAYSGGLRSTNSCPNGAFATDATLQGSIVHTGQAISGILV